MKQQRIYIVGHGETIRLVRASHRSQALGRQIAIENASDGEQGELEL